ncbi:hypothetical protein Pse7367_3457 [Thalassoporum mexicanum PCC 7367]|uniref:hypothetical protein n=1 Tax=Thalassoporum mexicanum TaxID=3457544 RepID=UPI00029FA2A4|nr:hypothetical protein [Pseudanabaena sp. PCC 7367]AFY71693.1 hypothetical protein Pse7367_3457 [Pseudanabaena sp. PCC 7367]
MKQLFGQRFGRLKRLVAGASLAGLALFGISIVSSSIGNQGKPEAIAQNFTGIAGISAPKLLKLKNLGVRVAVPEYVPSGFKVTAIDTKRCAPGMSIPCGHFPQYEIIYSNANLQCFAIESRPIIFEPILPDSSSRLNTRNFGRATLYHGSSPDQPNQTKVFSEWLERDRQYYRFTQVDDSGCQGTVEVEEAIEITESLIFVD